ncbi:MAG: hypothetical protein L0H63_12785 [Nitrococcus sp.]|nr:hypothetical protein [Nitrococcus sp.]
MARATLSTGAQSPTVERDRDRYRAHSRRRPLRWGAAVILAALFVAAVVSAVYLLDLTALAGLRGWFDPWYFTYNICLALTAILMPIAIALSYTRSMATEKRRRLERDLGASWAKHRALIEDKLRYELTFRNYWGGVALAVLITAFGAAALLLLKPLSTSMLAVHPEALGIDLTRGTNFLTLGPFVQYFGQPALVETQLYLNLAAFQFGFLGGWVYFIQSLVRSYFTCDLTTHTFVAGSVRMVVGAILALVLAFMLSFGLDPSTERGSVPNIFHWMPLVAFFFGYFPSRALTFLEHQVGKLLPAVRRSYRITPLSTLAGVSYAHENRLRVEGYDNVENLSRADAVDLALRTGFSFCQLSDWIGEAWLRVHLGQQDYDAFRSATGVTGRAELEALLPTTDADPGAAKLLDVVPEPMRGKLHVILALLRQQRGMGEAGG